MPHEITLRDYQQRTLDALYGWWMAHPDVKDIPIMVCPTGSGKSVILAELTRLLFDTWPEDHPRTVMLVPSKELAEQNAEKLSHLLPSHIRIGYYSASLGRKCPDADVIVATIGSIYKHAHVIGNIKCVLIDECFTGDTIISCTNRDKRIDQIEPGDAVYTATGIGIVQAVSQRMTSSILKIGLSNGTEITTTDNHPFFTNSGWKNAESLERGDGLVRIQDMRQLWAGVSTVDEENDRRNDAISESWRIRKSKILFDILLEEIRERHVGSWREGKNDGNAQKDSAQTIADWWKRPWNDRSSEGSVFDFDKWLDDGACNTHESSEGQRNLSNELQGGYRERETKDCNRDRRAIALREKAGSGREKGQISNGTWVESVSREELASPELVFNLQVGGHPSYFAGGVLVHNCHLVNPDGTEAGRYRQFLTDLARYCTFRVAGCTATPFRGNGYWLTEGDDPLFTGIAHEIRCQELLTAGFLAPLKPPDEDIETRIDTDDLRISGGDFVIRELSERVNAYLPGVVRDSIRLAADRNKWIAFTATVDNANTLSHLLNAAGVATVVVCGETPKQERADSIARFRAGEIRCLVTVMALATGFDVPDVDCVLWCRPTRSPVLFVQGAGRGLRPAPSKRDCLWLDFSDTTERLGPVDAIRGRAKPIKRNSDDGESNGPPAKVCDECGNRVIPASLLYCPECGFQLRDEFDEESRSVSTAPIMAHQMRQRLTTYPVTDVRYSVHHKAGSPDSMRVDYYSGLLRVASEWVCFEHTGFARAKAERWWNRRCLDPFDAPATVEHAVSISSSINVPSVIVVNEFGKFPEIVRFLWTEQEQAA